LKKTLTPKWDEDFTLWVWIRIWNTVQARPRLYNDIWWY
jgi:hypothetical protein